MLATHARDTLLFQRALPSIESQTRSADEVILIDDAANPELALQIKVDFPRVQLLGNRRTKGLSGSLNTGLDHLARKYRCPQNVFVAFLDDDDAWLPGHLCAIEQCIDKGAEVVAVPYIRLEGARGSRKIDPPTEIAERLFQEGNPGIQGATFAARLDVILEAGGFNEALPSCTDRDFWIRLSRRPDLAYQTTFLPSVHHYACSDRGRLSSPGSVAKLSGLDMFDRIHGPLMLSKTRERHLERAGNFFGWRPKSETPLAEAKQPPKRCGTSNVRNGDVPPLLVGIVVDDRRIRSASRLLDDLWTRVEAEGLAPPQVVLLENRPRSASGRDFAQMVRQNRGRLKITSVTRAALERLAHSGEWCPADQRWDGRLAISDARTALQAFLYHKALAQPGCAVWILDDDMRLDPLIASTAGAYREPLNLGRSLSRMWASGADICIGSYTGAPPLPAIASIRAQLSDLLWNLRRLSALPASSLVPSAEPHNSMLRANRRDYYHDLSRIETDRLETPFHLEPSHPKETCGEALTRLSTLIPRILAGEAPLRPLVANPEEMEAFEVNSGFLRGGNTFVFDAEALLGLPNVAPNVNGRPTRRSDMIWALLQERRLRRKVYSVPVPVRQDRSDLPVPERLDTAGIADDLRGYAIFNAMLEAGDDPDMVGELCAKYEAERLAALRLSFFRIRGLSKELLQWSESDAPGNVDRKLLSSHAVGLLEMFSEEAFREIEAAVLEFGTPEVRSFLEGLDGDIAWHADRILTSKEIPQILSEERANSALGCLPSKSPLRILGQGNEGVVFTDGTAIWKLFGRWSKETAERAVPILRNLARRTTPLSVLVRPHDIRETPLGWLLEMPFEETVPWQGGRGPGLVELLADLHGEGLACRNLHPKNLRVAKGVVRLVDYGADLVPLVDPEAQSAEFVRMCRRAWLCWRWWWREDIDELMRKSLHDGDLPELDGHENLIHAVRERLGLQVAQDPTIARALELRPRRVLDYGAGKGKQLAQLARAGVEAVAWDPDPAVASRLDGLAAVGVRRTRSAQEAIEHGPFDLVICRRVACLLDEAQLDKVLKHLRAAVAENGRVLFSLCHPAYVHRSHTAEAEPLERPDRGVATAWTKKARSTDRVLHEKHRTESFLRRRLMRAGFRIVGRHERQCVEFERFEIVSDLLVFELMPAAAPEATLLIKACAMDADTLDLQVRDILGALEGPGAFVKTVLALDTRTEGFLRPHATGDLEKARSVARLLLEEGEIDQIVETPMPKAELKDLNARWFGLNIAATHSAGGAATGAFLAGLDACTTRYVLHADVDMMIGPPKRNEDPVQPLLKAIQSDPNAFTASFPVAKERSQPWTCQGSNGPWRVESRLGLIDLERVRAILPLPNSEKDGAPTLSWHRAMDEAVRLKKGRSLRGGGSGAFCVHPPNARKRDIATWENVRLAIAQGHAPAIQHDRIEWVGNGKDWHRVERRERFVFVICGRNVMPERFRRCWRSVLRQDREDWGAIVIDDASAPWISDEIGQILAPHSDRVSFVARRRRAGLLANTVHAVRHMCASPEQVMITLDADDHLIGHGVLTRLAQAYDEGADLTVGSMIRTDKVCNYEVHFRNARAHRGGNVWQHLRSFRKGLFDAVPDDALRLDGSFVELASDWAFMLPMAEMANAPVWIRDPLYLHEPGEVRNVSRSVEREKVIARLVKKGTMKEEICA